LLDLPVFASPSGVAIGDMIYIFYVTFIKVTNIQ